ncbi:MAG: arsenate reductase ArsC [Candidatus Aminicenantes bacterium]|nr:arsenate reductase ArsC [Candidatus Aminicenantes bacterium]
MKEQRVLFVCIHNSARSQMAEAYFNLYSKDGYMAESAGIEPGELNPLVVEVMREEGIDISGNVTKSVFDFFKEGRLYSYVITVCDTEAAERCPIFPGNTERIHWSFKDPSKAEGTEKEKLAITRGIRDEIKEKIKAFVGELQS